MGLRPRTKLVRARKARRCRRCGAKMGRHEIRCRRCGIAQGLIGKRR